MSKGVVIGGNNNGGAAELFKYDPFTGTDYDVDLWSFAESVAGTGSTTVTQVDTEYLQIVAASGNENATGTLTTNALDFRNRQTLMQVYIVLSQNLYTSGPERGGRVYLTDGTNDIKIEEYYSSLEDGRKKYSDLRITWNSSTEVVVTKRGMTDITGGASAVFDTTTTIDVSSLVGEVGIKLWTFGEYINSTTSSGTCRTFDIFYL